MSEHRKPDLSSDRRRFFRIDDEIRLYYKKIPDNQLQDNSATGLNAFGDCSLATALDMMTQESQVSLHRLERNDPDVAEYLKVLNNKIDLVARALLMQKMELSEQKTRNVNMSASGIAFDSEELIQPGECLEIKMLLSSSMAVIITYGKVVRCEKNADMDKEYPYIVGVDYYRMPEQDREVLIKHVVKRQIQQIREEKESS